MQSQLTSLKNPQWADAEQTIINCEITTSQFGDEVLPFTASANDVEAHGRKIFEDLISGKYGEIEPFNNDSVINSFPTRPSGEIPVVVFK
jgi:hypothetical protein